MILVLITAILIALTIGVEAVFLRIQWKHQQLTKWFGENAFKVHSIVTQGLWILASAGILWLTFQPYPRFHEVRWLSILGWILTAAGMIVATAGYIKLGLDRSLGINFFKDDVPIETGGIYKYLSHPEEHGFWVMMIGFALGTASWYNLIFALEFILLMIPHQKIENLPLQESEDSAPRTS